MQWLKKIDVGTFLTLFIIGMLVFFGSTYVGGILNINNFISNLGGGYLNVFGWVIVFYGIELFQNGFGVNLRNKIVNEGNVAAAIYMGAIALALAILISKGFL